MTTSCRCWYIARTMANNDTSITATGFSSLNYNDGQCAICLGPHVDKSHLHCGHVFCYHCLVEWCNVKLQCPTCKRPFTSILRNIGSQDGQQIYTVADPSLGLAGHYMQTFALMLGDPEIRSRINRPDVIRQVDDFRQVLSDPQVLLPFDDPAFRTQLNDPEFGRTFDDPEVNRLLGVVWISFCHGRDPLRGFGRRWVSFPLLLIHAGLSWLIGLEYSTAFQRTHLPFVWNNNPEIIYREE